MQADIASTGISAVESADLKIGDTVAVFAQGPIGFCAMAGASFMRRDQSTHGLAWREEGNKLESRLL